MNKIDTQETIDFLHDVVTESIKEDMMIDNAVDALKKQIPKKVVISAQCPYCGYQMDLEYKGVPCCEMCGQRLEWE